MSDKPKHDPIEIDVSSILKLRDARKWRPHVHKFEAEKLLRDAQERARLFELANWFYETLDKQPPWRPTLDTLDPATASDAQRAQLAQHEAARDVLRRQDEYRKQHDCQRVPGKVTDTMLAEAMAEAANKFNVALSLLNESAVRTLVKNKRSKAH